MENRIREKIRDVRNAVETVEAGMPERFEEFDSLGLEKDGIYKNIEHAIQSCYDICAIILKERELEVPGEEEGIPDILVSEGIISQETADRLKDMKGFRNALSHRYGSIDDRKAYENIRNGFEDFEQFLSEIEDFLDE